MDHIYFIFYIRIALELALLDNLTVKYFIILYIFNMKNFLYTYFTAS